MIKMPGKSYRGPIPSLTNEEKALRDMLRMYVEELAGRIGERNYVYYENLNLSCDFLEKTFEEAGYKVRRHPYTAKNVTFFNLDVEILGKEIPDEIVIVGAHYDSIVGSVGANDNSTGAASILAMARDFSGRRFPRTIRFVQFVNEEPPFFMSNEMGSQIYARQCRMNGEKIVAMLSLETIGYYTDEKNSQSYPFPLNLFYPSTGNFIGFVGNVSSASLVKRVTAIFRSNTKFPSEGTASPGVIPGIGWSDHWSFWEEGYPAVMITDTAPFRYPYYHTPYDTPDRIKYDRLAIVVRGLEHVIQELASCSSPAKDFTKFNRQV